MNRLDETVFYKPLKKEETERIVTLLVQDLQNRLSAQNLKLTLTPAALSAVVEGGYDPVYGARPLKRYLTQAVETALAKKIVQGSVHAGDTLTVDYENESFTVRVEE